MNESKERDDVAFRIQERMLSEARLQLSYAREALGEVDELREHRDSLTDLLSVQVDKIEQFKATIEKLRVDCAHAAESLLKKDEMIDMLKKRVDSINNEYNDAYGIPREEARRRCAHVMDMDPPDVTPRAPIPEFTIDPYGPRVEIQNDHNNQDNRGLN